MKAIILLLTVALSSLSLTYDNNEPLSGTNVLLLQGEISNNERIDIMVFEYNYTKCQWERKETTTEKKNYELVLDPTKNYQVWFKKNSGQTKILYITKGKPIVMRVKMNIDFNSGLEFARLYQKDITTFFTTYRLQKEKEPLPEDFVFIQK